MRFSTLLLTLVALGFLSSSSLAQKPMNYEQAFKMAQKGDKPLLVLITSKFCPPCQRMKQTTLPELKASNDLKDCYLANVSADTERDLTNQLLSTMPVEKRGYPQLIIFEKKKDGKWYRRYHGGFMTANHVREFVAKSDLVKQARQSFRTAKVTKPVVKTSEEKIAQK